MDWNFLSVFSDTEYTHIGLIMFLGVCGAVFLCTLTYIICDYKERHRTPAERCKLNKDKKRREYIERKRNTRRIQQIGEYVDFMELAERCSKND